MRANRNKSKIIMALTVAILATLVSYSMFSHMRNQVAEQQKVIEAMQKNQGIAQDDAQYAYAVATTSLKAGEIVSDTDVDFKEFNIQNKNAFESRSDVVNKVLLKDITAGETFTNAHIAQISNDNVSLREGYRALTLPADNFQGRSDTMKPGSLVDIYSTASDSNWVLENVKILSFEAGKAPIAGVANSTTIMTANAITFEVSAGSISSFISNISKGKLMLVTRNPNDKKVVRRSPVSSGYVGPMISHRHSGGGGYSGGGGAYTPLPDIPSAVPITDFSGGGSSSGGSSRGRKHKSSGRSSGLSGLPQPVTPVVRQSSVEVIEANVKSRVTFD